MVLLRFLGLMLYYRCDIYSVGHRTPLAHTGHDCGHTTFSNYPAVNAVCGHLCHAPLLVPFWPWAKSHNEHHKYHNHIEKDMSYPWFGKEQFESEMSPIGKFWIKTPFHPFTAYFFTYLLAGWYDGSHFNPFSECH